MDNSFDGSRNLRLRPPCICGAIMKWEEDAGEWYCEECDLIVEPGWDTSLKVYDWGDEIIAVQDAIVTYQDENYPVRVSWGLTDFMIQVDTLTAEVHMELAQKIGLDKQSSRYWGALKDD